MTEPVIVRTVAQLRAQVRGWKAQGLRVGLVPTMGALHAGHQSLVTLALSHVDRVVATIFVNPTQFGPTEDFSRYPRDEAGDVTKLAAVGCHLVFAPDVAQMYPPGFATRVIVDGLTNVLCGAARPGHFDGVAQVVTKLLNQAAADVAVFGEKDWQQLAVIRRLCTDLDIPTEIIGAPILREADGLAMSSRNRYLTEAERAAAPQLHAALQFAAQMIRHGAPTAEACAAARNLLGPLWGKVDYLEAREAQTLALVEFLGKTPLRLFAAAHLGRARLIDNIPV